MRQQTSIDKSTLPGVIVKEPMMNIGALIEAYLLSHIKEFIMVSLRMLVSGSFLSIVSRYRYTRDLITELKNKGSSIVAISQSPKTVLDAFCKQYGFDKVYGRMYEIGPQDRFTGIVTDEHLIENKANIVKRVFRIVDESAKVK